MKHQLRSAVAILFQFVAYFACVGIFNPRPGGSCEVMIRVSESGSHFYPILNRFKQKYRQKNVSTIFLSLRNFKRKLSSTKKIGKLIFHTFKTLRIFWDQNKSPLKEGGRSLQSYSFQLDRKPTSKHIYIYICYKYMFTYICYLITYSVHKCFLYFLISPTIFSQSATESNLLTRYPISKKFPHQTYICPRDRRFPASWGKN